MDAEELALPGARDVRATLDSPTGRPAESSPKSVVVACPPHPQHRGHRGDARLTAVSEFLVERGIACLRFDYGDWDEGHGEREDARNALRWATDRYDRVGGFGFSFGGAMMALAAATVERHPDAVALLAPAAQVAPDLDAVAALDDLTCPLRIVYGTRDDTADWEPLVERAAALGHETVEVSADHFFVGQRDTVAEAVGTFLVETLGPYDTIT